MEVNPFVILLAVVFGMAFVLSKNWLYSSISVMDSEPVEFVKVMLMLIDAFKDIFVMFVILMHLLY